MSLGLSSRKKPFSFFDVVSEYAERMLPQDNTMKVLLMDDQTLGIISLAFTQTALLNRQVLLVDRMNSGNHRTVMKSMRCILFIRPQLSSISAACSELKAARYESYTIIFSSVAKPDALDQLARADTEGLVNSVQEFFCDFDAINNDAFTVCPTPHVLVPSMFPSSEITRVAEGLASMFVAMRRRPYVRFQRSSEYASRVAMELCDILSKDADLFNFPTRETVLLILDRNDDPLTPILTPWTYQAMLHELVGLENNRLALPKNEKEVEEYVFSQHDDAFFANNMFANWGDLCTNVKTYVEECKSSLNIDRSTATMEEVKMLLQNLPKTKSFTGSVTKHATVVTHLLAIIKKRNLLDVSLLEQDIVASSNQNEHFNRLAAFAQQGIEYTDLLRLCMLFNFRYERGGVASRTDSLLQTAQLQDSSSSTRESGSGRYTSGPAMLRKLRQYYGIDRGTVPLFGATGLMATIGKTFSDVSNVYTQHEPLLKKTLEQIYLGKLSSDMYGYVSPPSTHDFRPLEVITFICGGFTMEEAAVVNAVNSGTAFKASMTSGGTIRPGVRAHIGGTTALNSKMFLEQLQAVP